MLYVRSFPPVSSGSSLPALTQRIFTASRLPANSRVFACADAASFFQVHQVDDNLFRAQSLAQSLFIDSASSDDHNLGVLDRPRQVRRKQATDARNHVFDVLAVGSE